MSQNLQRINFSKSKTRNLSGSPHKQLQLVKGAHTQALVLLFVALNAHSAWNVLAKGFPASWPLSHKRKVPDVHLYNVHLTGGWDFTSRGWYNWQQHVVFSAALGKPTWTAAIECVRGLCSTKQHSCQFFPKFVGSFAWEDGTAGPIFPSEWSNAMKLLLATIRLKNILLDNQVQDLSSWPFCCHPSIPFEKERFLNKVVEKHLHFAWDARMTAEWSVDSVALLPDTAFLPSHGVGFRCFVDLFRFGGHEQHSVTTWC